jgi:hypothetical protein
MQRQQIIQQAQQQVAQLTQQLQQMQQTAPLVTSIPPSQDASEDHQIRAAIALAEMKSPRGRACKNGNPKQQAGYFNLHLNWQAHAQVAAQLAPPPQMESRASFTIDPTKLPPDAQTIAFEKIGLKIPPVALQVQPQTHEITEESEGLDPQTGVPVKRKISIAGEPLNH